MTCSITYDDLKDISNGLRGSSKIFKTVIYGSLFSFSGYLTYSYYFKK